MLSSSSAFSSSRSFSGPALWWNLTPRRARRARRASTSVSITGSVRSSSGMAPPFWATWFKKFRSVMRSSRNAKGGPKTARSLSCGLGYPLVRTKAKGTFFRSKARSQFVAVFSSA
ncbi:hypothetical protein D3C81_1841150 [compost metagenome]